MPAARDPSLQRLRRPGRRPLRRNGSEEVLLTTTAIPRSGARSQSRRLATVSLVLVCLLPAAWLARRALTDDLGANPIEELEIQTGLWTLRFLALTLTVTPVRRLAGWNWLAKHRRTLGLVTFGYACLHLSMYIGLDMFFDVSDIVEDVAEHLYITVGMLAFLLLIPLAATSTRNAIRRMGRRWTRLHRLVWAVAALGTVHFLWAVKKDIREPLIYAAIFAGLLLLRWPLRAKK
ncbi:MAG TPA: protein-methionine-sulfoxide reductase heme-binding subunit MsrQ [Gemmatimonadaceae bacterium]|nr:protein-methionine-sulfoxide reductase heme-binding subunit MsrQ [Gemmatimonadaceae bacterium]